MILHSGVEQLDLSQSGSAGASPSRRLELFRVRLFVRFQDSGVCFHFVDCAGDFFDVCCCA
jgi:hypothetical protein